MDDLPDPNCRRWTPMKKSRVVQAIIYGEINREEAMHRYNLSSEELHEWERDDKFGTHAHRRTSNTFDSQTAQIRERRLTNGNG